MVPLGVALTSAEGNRITGYIRAMQEPSYRTRRSRPAMTRARRQGARGLRPQTPRNINFRHDDSRIMRIGRTQPVDRPAVAGMRLSRGRKRGDPRWRRAPDIRPGPTRASAVDQNAPAKGRAASPTGEHRPDGGWQAYVVYDGHVLQACREAATAIAAVVHARRWCSAVDLSMVRTDRSWPLYKTDRFLRFKDSPAFVLAVSTCVWP